MEIQYGQYKVPEAETLVNFGVGQPSNVELPLEIIKKACIKLGELNDKSVLQYGDIPGYKEFRKILSAFLERNLDVNVNIDNLFVTNGVTGALSLISSLFISKCKKVYVEEPTYFLAINIFKEFGFEVETINLENDGIDINELSDKLDGNTDEVKLLYTIPTFHNPTSFTMSDDKRKKLIELSERHNMYIIADEVYQLLYFDEKPPLPLYYYGGNVFSMSSFSKILAPSLRLGWIQCNDKLMSMLKDCGQLDSSGGINPFISRIVHNIIEAGDLDEYILNTRQILKERCNTLSESLSDLSFIKPTGGYFIWIDTPFDSRQFLKYCEDKKVKFHTGNKFSGYGKLENYLRLSFSFYDKDGLQVGGNRLCNAYNEYMESEFKTKLFVYGSSGRLGSKISNYAVKNEYKVIELNRDLSNLEQFENSVIIDVTSVNGTNKLVSVLLHQKINMPLIIGTTGVFNKVCSENIREYSKKNPVFVINNFSYGIPAIEGILGDINLNDWNVKIKETHHENKIDAPSGTAKMFGNRLNINIDEIESVREGEVFGKHEITFESDHEIVKIIHEAKDRDIFADGSLRFIDMIKEKKNGLYTSNFSDKTNEFKYSVCGNTFLVTNSYPVDKMTICKKCVENNVDGLIWYALDENENFDFEWKYWNNDGSFADICINGSRSIFYHIYKLVRRKEMKFRNASGVIQKGTMLIDKVAVSIPEYKEYREIDDNTYFVNVGVNHVIRYLDNDENLFDYKLKEFYDYMNKDMQMRSNVSIVKEIDNKLCIRTWERGVENETGACGSACVAAYFKYKRHEAGMEFLPKSEESIFVGYNNNYIYISSKVKDI